ncbi:MAG: hypothetical protein A2020_13340 [Lentisphaerae bacterium GWF2_45_14]|nr:MAG: hypothetical protein A2020_13340 [Lentisphaerae bacterium GWF2_45_14]
MMIKCQKCGFENQLGAIFCRQCGGKLELDELRPEVKDKKKQGCFKTGCKIFIVLFLLLISSVIFILFFPLSYTEPTPFPEKDKAALEEKMTSLQGALDGKNKLRFYSFTPAETSYLLSKLMLDNNLTSEPIDVVIEVRDDAVYLVLQKKFLGVLRFRAEVRGRPELTENADGKTNFNPNIDYFKFGNVPGISFSTENIMDKIEDEDAKTLIMNIIGKIQKFQISKEGNFDILLKKRAPAAKKSPGTQ